MSEKKERKPGALDRFHLFNDAGKITGVYDYEIFSYLMRENDMFVLGGVPYLYEGGYFKADISGAILSSMIRECIYPQYIKSSTIKRVFELFIKAVELQVTFDDLNKYPAHWVNFQNGFYDPISMKMIPHDPKYKAINQVQMPFEPDEKPAGAYMEEWLRFALDHPRNREMFLQFCGYCLTRDTRQQKFLVLLGEGGTGKSTAIRLPETIIGEENVSNISLLELTQRFSSYGLLGKLLNTCADLEVTALEDTSIIKKILGEDTIRAEAKGKDAFSFKSYAKLIFSTNELPIVKGERTNGFYRRLLVLPMDKVPEVKRPDLFDKLRQELPYFLHLCMDALHRMYQEGHITESEQSEEAVQRLRMDSDTIQAFIIDKANDNPEGRTERGALFRAYTDYCEETERQPLNRNGFYRAMRFKGYNEIKSCGERCFQGITLGKTAQNSAPQTALPSGFVVVDEPMPF